MARHGDEEILHPPRVTWSGDGLAGLAPERRAQIEGALRGAIARAAVGALTRSAGGLGLAPHQVSAAAAAPSAASGGSPRTVAVSMKAPAELDHRLVQHWIRDHEPALVDGRTLRYRGRRYELVPQAAIADAATLSSLLSAGRYVLRATGREGFGVRALAAGTAYEVSRLGEGGAFLPTNVRVIAVGLDQGPEAIVVQWSPRVELAPIEIVARAPVDVEVLARRLIALIDQVGTLGAPAIAVNAVLALLRERDLIDEEVMDVLRALRRAGRLTDFLQLHQVLGLRDYLAEKHVPWEFVYANWEASVNDQLALFAGFLVGVGESFYDAARLLYVLTGSIFSRELAEEGAEMIAGAKQFFSHPIVIGIQGARLLAATFEEKLWKLEFFDAGRILGQVVITVLTLPSAVRSTARLAVSVARLTVRGLRTLGVTLADLRAFLLTPRERLVTSAGRVLMEAGDDIAVTDQAGQTLGKVSKADVLAETAKAAEAAPGAPVPGRSFASAAEIDEVLKGLADPNAGRAHVPIIAGHPLANVATIEEAVSRAIQQLRSHLGATWLPAREFGTRLHAVVEYVIRTEFGSAAGWTIAAETPMSDLGVLSKLASLTVADFLALRPNLAWLKQSLRAEMLAKTIGTLRPDLVIKAPGGPLVLWDLTASSGAAAAQEHLAKTILYVQILSEEGVLVHVGETYWRAFKAGAQPAALIPQASAGAKAAEESKRAPARDDVTPEHPGKDRP